MFKTEMLLDNTRQTKDTIDAQSNLYAKLIQDLHSKNQNSGEYEEPFNRGISNVLRSARKEAFEY